jgi:hypothetical protein
MYSDICMCVCVCMCMEPISFVYMHMHSQNTGYIHTCTSIYSYTRTPAGSCRYSMGKGKSKIREEKLRRESRGIVLVAFAGKTMLTRSMWYGGGEDIGPRIDRNTNSDQCIAQKMCEVEVPHAAAAAAGVAAAAAGGEVGPDEGLVDMHDDDESMLGPESDGGASESYDSDGGDREHFRHEGYKTNAVHTCGHAIHGVCFSRYMQSLRQRRSHIVHGASFEDANRINMDDGEYPCPICRRVANLSIPVQRICRPLPALSRKNLQTTHTASVDGKCAEVLPIQRPATKLSSWKHPNVCMSAGKYSNSTTLEAARVVGTRLDGWGVQDHDNAEGFVRLFRDQIALDEVCGRQAGGRGFSQQTLALLACTRHHTLASQMTSPPTQPVYGIETFTGEYGWCVPVSSVTAWDWFVGQCPHLYTPRKRDQVSNARTQEGATHAHTESAAAAGAHLEISDSRGDTRASAGDSDTPKTSAGDSDTQKTSDNAKKARGSRTKPASLSLQRRHGWSSAIDGNCHSVLTIDLLTLACAVLVREPEKESDGVLEVVGALYIAQIVQVCSLVLCSAHVYCIVVFIQCRGGNHEYVDSAELHFSYMHSACMCCRSVDSAHVLDSAREIMHMFRYYWHVFPTHAHLHECFFTYVCVSPLFICLCFVCLFDEYAHVRLYMQTQAGAAYHVFGFYAS